MPLRPAIPGKSPLVHSRLMRKLGARIFPSELRIVIETVTNDPDTNEEIVTPAYDERFGPINAHIEPQVATSGEQRDTTQTIVRGDYVCYLAGYYPELDREMIAEADSVRYNITDIAHDDTNTLTVLGLERIEG